MRVPTNAPDRFNRRIATEIDDAVRAVLDSGWYVLGPEVRAFEQEFAAFTGANHCVGVASGTDALELGLRAVGVAPGDLVTTVANAGMYATIAIMAVGAEPCFVDVNPQSMNVEAGAIEASIGPRTKALVVTHLYGRLADMATVNAVAGRYGLPVIEDCAQAHGAERGGKKAGSSGSIGCFSFYPTKNLGALGDGGALTTSDPALHHRLLQLRQYGWEEKYHSTLPGGRNSRLDEIQAAVLRRKLVHLDAVNEERRGLALAYGAALQGTDLELPEVDSGYVAHLYVVRTKKRDELLRTLRERGVGAEVHYPVPDHRQTWFAARHPEAVSLPVTEALAREVMTLPLFPGMTAEEHAFVVSCLRALS